MAASQQQTLHAEFFAGTHLGDGVIKATKEDNSTRVRKKPFIDVNRNISITNDNYPNSQGTDQYEPKLCDIIDGSKLEEHKTEDSSDSNKVQDSNLQSRLQSTMRSLPDFSQLSLEDRASQVPLRASTPSPHATSSGLVFSEVQPNPRLPSPFVGCSRSKSDHDISDITEYGPKPTRSNSDHVPALPALPSLTRTECRRHTLPSLLPTITIWEAEGPGPDTGSSASDLSEADPNFLLPVECPTMVSSTLLQKRRKSLPSLPYGRTKLAVVMEEQENKQSGAQPTPSPKVPRHRRRSHSLDNSLATRAQFATFKGAMSRYGRLGPS